MIEARDLEPLRVGRDHPPRREVVERRAPQHRLLAAGVHRDVAADARRFGRRRIDREDVAGALGGVGDALGDDAGLGPDRRDLAVDAGQRIGSTSVIASSFSVLMTALRQLSGTAPPV